MYEEFILPELVELYDILNPWGPDNDFYLNLVNEISHSKALSILDIGCGTGMLACAFALNGHHVIGIDQSSTMLKYAQSRREGKRVLWVEELAQTFESNYKFDLIIMSGHSFQFLVSDQDIENALANMAKHLKKTGQIVFETRNPNFRPWNSWINSESHQIILTRDARTVEVRITVSQFYSDQLDYDTCYRFLDTEAIFRSRATLKFLDQEALEKKISQAGLCIDTIYGDWDRKLFIADKSPEIIVIASLQNIKI